MATNTTPKTNTPALPPARPKPAFQVDVTILARGLDDAVDITHDIILRGLREAGVPFIHEATRAKPSQAAAELAATREDDDSFEAVARDLWSGMAMGMSLSHYDSHKVHDRLHKLAKAEKNGAKPSRPATEGGAAKLALATLGVRAIEYEDAHQAYLASKVERLKTHGYGAGASTEVLHASVKADELLGQAARQYAATVAANKASQPDMEA